MSLQGKRILITGATGGLGRHAIDALRARGASVAGIDRKRGDSDRETILADVRDEGQVVRGVALSCQLLDLSQGRFERRIHAVHQRRKGGALHGETAAAPRHRRQGEKQTSAARR